jgi:hypothetical protein
MRKADEEAEIISDWKFAAMVVDRSVKSYNFIPTFMMLACPFMMAFPFIFS